MSKMQKCEKTKRFGQAVLGWFFSDFVQIETIKKKSFGI